MRGRTALRLKRISPARRALVYRSLSDPAELAKWWGPRGFTAPSVELDPYVGGSYRIAMQPPDGELFYLSGEFREVNPPPGPVYTFRWGSPRSRGRQTLVSLSLEDRGERTEVLVCQGTFATEDRRTLQPRARPTVSAAGASPQRGFPVTVGSLATDRPLDRPHRGGRAATSACIPPHLPPRLGPPAPRPPKRLGGSTNTTTT